MDTLTQIALGGAVATICVPTPHRRKAVIIGAVLGTIPDLDVFMDYGDAVANFTYHRGFSHSLFILIPLSVFIWATLKKIYDPVKSAPIPWLFAISLALVTHPLLDAHTAYGTQLFWPLTSPPIMWSTIFIIDPLYTLPLLIGIIVVLINPLNIWASRAIAAGLLTSTLYLGWTWLAKFYVDNQSVASLSGDKEFKRIFSTPTPFNSILWRLVILYEDNYLEGYYSLLQPKKTIKFQSFIKNEALIDQLNNLKQAQRLDWFTQGLIKTAVVDDRLVISDLRMGLEGNYVFNFSVAEVTDTQLHEIKSKRLPFNFSPEDLSFFWRTLTNSP